jgi:hypothetical protein
MVLRFGPAILLAVKAFHLDMMGGVWLEVIFVIF